MSRTTLSPIVILKRINSQSLEEKNFGSTKLGDGGDLLGGCGDILNDGDALFEWESENATFY